MPPRPDTRPPARSAAPLIRPAHPIAPHAILPWTVRARLALFARCIRLKLADTVQGATQVQVSGVGALHGGSGVGAGGGLRRSWRRTGGAHTNLNCLVMPGGDR